MTRILIPIVVFVALGLPACGEDGSNCGEGNDLVPELFSEEDYSQTHWFSFIGVEESNRLSGNDTGHDTLFQAHFQDTSNYQVQLAPRDHYSKACYIITGRQVTVGEPITLTVGQVAFAGLQGADVTLDPDPATHEFPTQVVMGRAFSEGMLSVDVASGAGATDFPAFQEEIAAPDAPQLTQLGSYKNPDLAQPLSLGILVEREDPLVVKWKPGDGQRIEVVMIPGAGSSTQYQKLRCITFDDGCLEIPSSAIGNLALDDATNFRLLVERHNTVPVLFKDGDMVTAVAVLDVCSLVDGVVGR